MVIAQSTIWLMQKRTVPVHDYSACDEEPGFELCLYEYLKVVAVHEADGHICLFKHKGVTLDDTAIFKELERYELKIIVRFDPNSNLYPRFYSSR
jgi:hypothetical protein